MRVGIVRTDLNKIYLSDVENTSQRNFSSEPKGQSRYFRRPSDAVLTSALSGTAFVTVQGSNTAATVDTTVANGTKLNLRTSSAAPFTQVTVTSSATLAKTQIVTELNLAFINAGLGVRARIAGTNQITLDTTAGGPSAYLEISAVSPSAAALHTVLGIAAAATSGLSLSALRTAVYPTPTTIDVSSATVLGLSTFSLLTAAQADALLDAVQDAVAPRLVETGAVLLSFAFGILSKMRSATFQPGGARIGLPAGIAAAVVEDDGVTPFVL